MFRGVIRFDEQARRVTLSVRDLAEEADYRFAGSSPVSLKRRALLGQQAHEVHQGAREGELRSYRRERSVRYETRIGAWTAVVTGRIDGIYTDGEGRTVIEEVKTVLGTPEKIDALDAAAAYPHYVRQLQLYRHLLEEGAAALGFEGKAPEIALHLVVIALPSRHRRTVALPYDRAACAAHVQRRLASLVVENDGRAARVARRRANERDIRFPHGETRPAQADMVNAIERALDARRPILVSAPTGTGKTAAALVPALRHAARIGGRVVVATSKTTQQAIVARTVRLLRATGAPVRAVVLQAREKACLNDVVDCRPEGCRYAEDYARKLATSGAAERLLDGGVADSEAIAAEARAHLFCPFEAALDLIDEVDVIIGDYNYVFDPGAALRRVFVDEDPKDVVLVIDEAHNLYDRGMDYYSPALRRELLHELGRVLDASSGGDGPRGQIARRARAVLDRLLDELARIAAGGEALAPAAEQAPPPPAPPSSNLLLFDDPAAGARPATARAKRAPSGRRPSLGPDAVRPATQLPVAQAPARPQPSPPRPGLPPEREVTADVELLGELRDELAELAVAWFAEGGRAPRGADDPVIALSRVLGRFVQVLELGGEEFSVLWREADGGSLKLLCKDPSRQLARRIRACAGAVAISATLEPLEFYRDVLGFGPDAAMASFPTSFDPARRCVLVLDRPSTRYQERDRDLPIVEDAVRAVLAARAGNYLVACPSFDYLEKLAARLERVPGFDVLVQPRTLDEPGRAEVMARLRRAADGQAPPVVLVTVQGGIFTEGVDYPGALCIGAIIVGPGLPRVSFERALIQAHYERAYRRGFDYAFLYPGMSRVIQAAGRVIRTATDEGVVVLVGDRFATDRYARLFPRDWYTKEPRELVVDDPYGALVRFWKARDAARAASSPR